MGLLSFFGKKEKNSMDANVEQSTVEQTPQETSETVPVDREKVMQVLNMLRPYLQADGGDAELVDITDDGVVQLRLHGACGSCPSSTYTLKMGIEEQMRQYVPGVKEVVSV
jgi:Fe-S cluster biogenesis protein NfuA